MKQLFTSKLMKRNLITTLLLTFLSLSILFLLINFIIYHSVRGEVENRNQLLAKTLGKNTDYILLNVINDMKIISEYSKRLNLDEDQNLMEMEEIIFGNPLYYHARVFNENKEIISNVPNVTFSNSPEDKPLINRMEWSQTYYISDMFTLEGGRKTIAVSYPILDENDTYRGGVIAYLNLHTLSRLLSQVKLGQQGINVLLDSKGKVISSNVEEFMTVDLSQHILGENLYKDKRGVWYGRIFDQSMTFAYQPVKYGNFGVLVGEPNSQAIKPVTQLQKFLLIAFFIGLGLTFIVTIFSTMNIIGRLTNLTHQAKQYKESNQAKINIIRSDDEIGELSVMMDEMANELIKKEKDLANILESIPYAVVTTNREGEIITFNKGAEKLTQFDRTEVIGKRVIDVPFKRNQNEFINLKTLMAGKKFEDEESYILDKNGNYYNVRVYSNLFYDNNDRVIGSIMILRDVSKLKKMEEDLKRAEHMASLGRLTAGVAHEIKNPLSIIHAAAEAIKIEIDPQQSYIIELTDDILETSERMNELIVDFLKLSKGNIEEQTESIDILLIIDELLLLLRNRFDKNDIIVHKHFHIQEAIITSEKSKISQLLLNVLINGIQAMENGGNLSISVSKEHSTISIIIKDSGEGITTENLELVFDPFFTTKKSGTGLGLSIAYETVTQYNGTIEIISENSVGTTVIIKFPQ